MTKATCEQCGKPESVRSGRRFCSQRCMAASQTKDVEVRHCEQCGAAIDRKIFPSDGRPEGPGAYANRRFCSRSCVAASRAGVPAGWRKPTPERSCENCGRALVRRDYGRRMESVFAFSKRRACSAACRDSLRSQRSRWRHDAHAIGFRTLIARTCIGCGELKDASAFYATGDGYINSRCSPCALDLGREGSRRFSARKQAETLETAVHYGEQWTGPQLEVAMRTDLSVAEIAAVLGRTYSSVCRARSLAKGDPRKRSLAGISRAEQP